MPDTVFAGQVSQLSLLYEVSRSFSERIELDQLIPHVIATTKQLLNAEGAAILLLDAEHQELYFPYVAEAAPEVDRRLAKIRFPADQGIAGWVVQHGVPQLIEDAQRDARWYPADKETGVVTRSLLCAPLKTRERVIGVIELRNRLEGTFTAEDLDFLSALAAGIAVAIENARLYGLAKAAEAQLRDEVSVLHREVARRSRFADIIGNSAAMQPLFHLMESAVTSPVTVLLQGETGTGKELIAAAIHYNGPRKQRPFVPVNCAALPENLLESELFGHRKGAFTGALTEKKGLFEVADGGTVFLDEIGEMPTALQGKLLRVLQSGEIRSVGDTKERRVDVRVISATNREVEADVKRKRFRDDLYYRLSTFPITVPPLRARKEDIPLLAAHFLKRTAEKFGKRIKGFSPEALDRLTRYEWPGNVRELENEIARAVALTLDGELIEPALLSTKLAGKRRARVAAEVEGASLKHARDSFEAEYIAEALRAAGGNASRAAKALGMSRTTLQMKIKEYALRTK